jgi:hypothetical protein
MASGGDVHATPPQVDLGVVSLLLGDGADPVDERQRRGEVARGDAQVHPAQQIAPGGESR